MGNLSFMQYTGIIFQVKGKKIPLIFLMHPYIITYMIDEETHEVSTGQIYIFNSSEAPDIYS